MTLYGIYCGPTIVHSLADWLALGGMTIEVRGTERVWIWFDGSVDDLVLLLAKYGSGWTHRDIYVGRSR